MPGSITGSWRIGFEVSRRNAGCQIHNVSCSVLLAPTTVKPTISTGAKRGRLARCLRCRRFGYSASSHMGTPPSNPSGAVACEFQREQPALRPGRRVARPRIPAGSNGAAGMRGGADASRLCSARGAWRRGRRTVGSGRGAAGRRQAIAIPEPAIRSGAVRAPAVSYQWWRLTYFVD